MNNNPSFFLCTIFLYAIFLIGCQDEQPSIPPIVELDVVADGSSTDPFLNPPQMSVDSRYILFTSNSTNLVNDDSNDCFSYWIDAPVTGNCLDVFLYDRDNQTTKRISMGEDGVESDGESYGGQFSPDGSAVYFWSRATNLVSADEQSCEQFDFPTFCYGVYRYDIATEDMEVIVQMSFAGTKQDRNRLTISADERFITFNSEEALYFAMLDPAQQFAYQYVLDRTTGNVIPIYVAPTCTDLAIFERAYAVYCSDTTEMLYVSADSPPIRLNPAPNDGSFVLSTYIFNEIPASTCINEQNGQEEPCAGLILLGAEDRNVDLFTVGIDGEFPDDHVYFRGISAEGNRILVETAATNMQENASGDPALYLYDTDSEQFQSLNPLAQFPEYADQHPVASLLSADGNWITFNNSGDAGQVFLYDIEAGTAEVITVPIAKE